jgi:hypothetical protein
MGYNRNEHRSFGQATVGARLKEFPMQHINPLIWVLIGVVIVVALAAWFIYRNRRTAALRDAFGDEYDRTLDTTGGRARAEAALEDRQARVAKLDVRPLDERQRVEFSREWRNVKAVFVDSPVEAVHHADRLLSTIMTARGYPMADFDRRYEDLTVDHGEVARHYRDGHEIVLKHGRGQASTEDLRQAMIHFEALFDDLVNEVPDHDDARPVKTPQRAG